MQRLGVRTRSSVLSSVLVLGMASAGAWFGCTANVDTLPGSPAGSGGATGGRSSSGGADSASGGTASAGASNESGPCLEDDPDTVVQDLPNKAAFCAQKRGCEYPSVDTTQACTSYARSLVAALDPRPTTAEELQSACHERLDSCLANPTGIVANTNGGIEELRHEPCGDQSQCTRTVADVERCITDMAQARDSLPTCDTLSPENVDDGAPIIASCKALGEDCF